MDGKIAAIGLLLCLSACAMPSTRPNPPQTSLPIITPSITSTSHPFTPVASLQPATAVVVTIQPVVTSVPTAVATPSPTLVLTPTVMSPTASPTPTPKPLPTLVPTPTTAPTRLPPTLTHANTATTIPTPIPTIAPANLGNVSAANDNAIMQLLALHNQARAGAGVRPLRLSAALQASAQRLANDCARRGATCSHDGSDGSTFYSRIKSAGYAGNTTGENWAFTNRPNGVQVPWQLWMNSPGHRQNILNPAFQEVGFAIATSAGGVLHFVADFGGVP